MEERSIYQVLAKVQHSLAVPKGRVNKFGGYSYRSLEDINAALKPICEENRCGYIFTDEIVPMSVSGSEEVCDFRWYLKATVEFFADGCKATVKASAYAREPVSKKGMDDAQVTGLASSYARKYAACALFAIDSGEEVDSMDNGSQQKGAQAKNKGRRKQTGSAAPEKAQTPENVGDTPVKPETLNMLTNLMQQYATMCGRKITDVADALQKTSIMRSMGYTGEDVTEAQCASAAAIVSYWIRKTEESVES